MPSASEPPPPPVVSRANDKDDDDDDDEPLPPPPTRGTHSSDEQQEILRVNAGDECIEICNVRLFSFDELALDAMTHCVSLTLRKNLLHELAAFPAALAARLRELDLFDNKIRAIGGFFELPAAPFCALTKLDLSYNQIKEIRGLDALGPTLTELYLVENRIRHVRGLDALVNLRLLELGGNRIRELGDGLRSLVQLEQLWLGKNKIERLGTAFHSLGKLTRLSLQANRLTAVGPEAFPEGCQPHLAELYLSENGLTEIAHLEHLHALTLLDFSFNPIRTLNAAVVNSAVMPLLSEFWLTDGRIDDWAELDKLRGFEATLRTVYAERNPIERDKRYRDKVFLALPFVTQIDSWPVVNKGDLEADRAIHRR